MNKTTKTNFSKKLGQYVAFAGVVAGVSEASGQIEYTDVTPDFVGGNGTSVGLDLDDDNNFDFVIVGATAPAVGIYGYNSIAGNSFVGSAPSYIYPFALNGGDVISAGQSTWFGGSDVGTLNYNNCYSGIGGSNWCGVTDKYLGLRFQISGNTHYGWVLMDVSASGDSFTLKSFAYNTVAGESILAGQQATLSLDQNILEDVRIVALNKSIGVYNISETTDYNVFALTGQSVLKGSINDRAHTIEANSLQTGIYILELRDKETNAVIRKKVVL